MEQIEQEKDLERRVNLSGKIQDQLKDNPPTSVLEPRVFLTFDFYTDLLVIGVLRFLLGRVTL